MPGSVSIPGPRSHSQRTAWSLAGLLWCLSTILAGGAASSEPAFNEEQLEFFEREVRPLLSRRCYECHSARAESPEGGLRLDGRALVLKGGDTGPAIQPGKPDESLLIDAIRYGDLYQMPPKSKLPEAEIAILTRWVEMGAPWPDEKVAPLAEQEAFDLAARKASHWCWQPVRSPALPDPRQMPWVQDDLDRFILRALEARGLSPAPRAPKEVLIRRASFDLIGLPPSPEQVQAFLADDSPQAFARVVDHLLDSPHFGERWARHWLDLVRYAETFGHEFDYPIEHAYKYRDYVVRAWNADVPYDQWILEQVAGDLLDPPRRHPVRGFNESVIGTGFWWLGEATHAPVDVRGDEAGRIDNQLDVLSKTFLGLTVACARCHDHKFDAISTRDYYALAGFLQSSRRHEALLDPGGTIAGRIATVDQHLAAGQRVLREELAPAVSRDQRLARYLTAALELQAGEAGADGSGRSHLETVARETGLDTERLERWMNALRDDDVESSRHGMFAWHRLSGRPGDWSEAVAELQAQLDAEQERARESDEQLPLFADFEESLDGWFVSGHAFRESPTRAGQWHWQDENLQLATPGLADSGQRGHRLQGVLRSPTFTLRHPEIHYRLAARNARVRLVVDGYFMDVHNGLLFRGFTMDLDTDGRMGWHRQAQDVGRYVGRRAYIEILDRGDGFVSVDEIRFSNGAAPVESPSRLNAAVLRETPRNRSELAAAYEQQLGKLLADWPSGHWTRDQTEWLNWLLAHDLIEVPAAAAARLASHRRELLAATADMPAPEPVLALTEGTPEDEHVFIRGNHRTLGPVAPRHMLEAISGRPRAVERGSGRLRLARQIADPANPLTARVAVNRLWHHLFGRGVVASVDNFGVLGQRPTHPELLDHLAIRFVDGGWSVKSMLRAMMLSSTYQMSSTPRESSERLDPANRWWHRMPLRRLEGEAIRDALLAISGRLDRSLYGPSVPVHITGFMQGRGRPKDSGPLDGNGRRSIYVAVRRNFLSPMMLAFDTPIPFSTVGRRNVSNVPAQALIMMNDPFVVAQSGEWARRLLADKGLSVRDRIVRMYQASFARTPAPGELERAVAFLHQQGRQRRLTPEQAESDEQVWADLGHVLWNAKEFVFLR